MVKKRIEKAVQRVKRFARLDPLAFAFALAILFTICMLILGILGSLGYWQKLNSFMMDICVGYNIDSIFSIILGAVYSFLHGFIIGYIIAWLYNKLGR